MTHIPPQGILTTVKTKSQPVAQGKPDKLAKQLKRISGQIDGILRMYEDERACIDIVHQVIAARNSLGTVAKQLLSQEAVKCSKERTPQKLDKVLHEVFRYQ